MKTHHFLQIFYLTAVMAISLAASVQADESDFTYDATNQRLAQYSGAGGDVTVPAEVDGAAVEVLYGTFNSNDAVTGITLPDSVRVLDASSVYALTNLTSITLPENLQIIGDYNFWLCDSLAEVTIPSSVTCIGSNSFQSCENLLSVTFTGAAPVIGNESFVRLAEGAVIYVPDDQYDAYLAVLPADVNVETSGQAAVIAERTAPESDFDFDAETGTITAIHSAAYDLDIPETIGGVPVRAIGESAADAFSLEAYRITIPEGVETVGSSAFSRPKHLMWVDFPSTLLTIGDSAFELYMGKNIRLNDGLEEIGAGAFATATLSGELDLPAGLKTVGAEAFRDIYGLTSVYFPDSIESIGANAFAGTGVNYLNFAGTTLPEIDSSAFAGLSISDVDMDWHTTMAEVREGQAYFDSLGVSTTVWSNNPFSGDVAITVGYNVGDARAATYAEADDGTCLESYSGTEPDIAVYTAIGDLNVVGVGEGALRDNQVIRSFYPHHCGWFTTISDEAFAGSSLEYIEMFDSITTVGDGAFRDCKNLTEITLPESLTSVGAGILDGCDQLGTVRVLCDTSILPDDMFAGCKKLLNNPAGIELAADVPDSEVARLSDGMGLAWNQQLLREGEMNEGLEITAMPFEPTDEQYFEIDAETGTLVSYTGTDADVVVPREIGGVEVKAIGYNAFEACRDYTDTEIETNQTEWTHLRSVVLPETVTEIADSAFSYCQQLEVFICYGPAASTGRGTFSECRKLTTVVFVNGVGMIDNYAFEGTDRFETFYSPVPLRYLGESAFVNSGVRTFVIDAVSVGNSAFANCDELFELHFTDAVKQVDYAVANNCGMLGIVCFETTDLSFLPNDGIVAGTPGLITVRVPEDIDEENLERADHVLMWGTEGAEQQVLKESCERPQIELPDIDAILRDYAEHPYEAADE